MRFSLVELMVVVAIIMVLAAIGLPMLYDAQLKARVAEVPLNTGAILDQLVAWESAQAGNWAFAPLTPSGSLGKYARPWQTGTSFEQLGFAPDGAVRCQYRFNYSAPGFAADAVAHCDLDGDGVVVAFHGMVDLALGTRTMTSHDDVAAVCFGGPTGWTTASFAYCNQQGFW